MRSNYGFPEAQAPARRGRTRHVPRAAEAVNLSQPALSRSIQALETELACRCSTWHRAGCLTLTAPAPWSARAACATKRPSYSANSSACTAANPAAQHRPESHSGLVAAVSVGPYDGAPSAGARQRGAGRDRCAAGVARRTHRRWSATRACCTTRRTSTQPLAPLRAGLVCRAGHPIAIGASASRRSGNTRSRPPAQSGSLCGWPETLGPGGAPGTNGDRAART